MTALLEWKQKIKTFYGKHDTLILPILKFLLAFLTFKQIDSSLGFMSKLGNVFILLILSILCSVLPLNTIAIIGVLLIVGHCYALGIEIAAFALILILLLMILFLRFSSKENLALILTPTAFRIGIPAALPIGSGLLGTPMTIIPSACGVILYYFMKTLKDQESLLKGEETEIIEKLKLLLDSLIKNQNMWLNMIAFVAAIIVVYVIRKMAIDYSWRIAAVTGGLVYAAVMIAGGLFMDVDSTVVTVILSAAGGCLIGWIVEFFVLGVDYTSSKNLQFEDDEYVYFVKAVPKSLVTYSERNIKNIAEEDETEKAEEEVPLEKASYEDVDFEEKLEDSLKDL